MRKNKQKRYSLNMGLYSDPTTTQATNKALLILGTTHDAFSHKKRYSHDNLLNGNDTETASVSSDLAPDQLDELHEQSIPKTPQDPRVEVIAKRLDELPKNEESKERTILELMLYTFENENAEPLMPHNDKARNVNWKKTTNSSLFNLKNLFKKRHQSQQPTLTNTKEP